MTQMNLIIACLAVAFLANCVAVAFGVLTLRNQRKLDAAQRREEEGGHG